MVYCLIESSVLISQRYLFNHTLSPQTEDIRGSYTRVFPTVRDAITSFGLRNLYNKNYTDKLDNITFGLDSVNHYVKSNWLIIQIDETKYRESNCLVTHTEVEKILPHTVVTGEEWIIGEIDLTDCLIRQIKLNSIDRSKLILVKYSNSIPKEMYTNIMSDRDKIQFWKYCSGNLIMNSTATYELYKGALPIELINYKPIIQRQHLTI